MIIKSLFINRFGGLANKSLDFTEGLNVISLPNEGGKSTIAEFIRVMLFGVNSLRFNQRKQYMPFGETAMGGELTLEHKGTEYIIRRTFGTRKSADKIEVVNALTFTPVPEYAVDNVGEVILGISGDTFENTCYIKQLSCGIDESKSAEIQTRLINLSRNASEDYSYKSAVNILDSAIRELVKPRGKINSTQAEIHQLVLKRNEKLKIKEEYKACKDELERLKTEDTRDTVSYHLVRSAYLPAVLSLLLLFFLKPWLVAVIFAILLVPAVLLSVRTRNAKADKLEYARRTGFYESRLESLRAAYEKIDISGLEALNARLQKYNKAVNDLNYAKEKLGDAFEEMQEDYVPRLNGNAAAIFEQLTNGRYDGFFTDEKYNVTVRDKDGATVSGEYLSKGAYDQIYFALRMSLADMIGENAPLIFDDAFALYDDSRLERAMEYLKGKNRQIIVFSCQSRESDIIKNIT